MIIQHTSDKKMVLFIPEDTKERKVMQEFPGTLWHGHQYYCPNKPHIIYSLYQRLSRKIKRIKYTPDIKAIVEGDIEIKQIPDWFKFHTTPLKHQLIALRFAYTFGSYMNLSEPGLGKTKVTLDYIWLMQFKKSLIVCPKALRFVWEEERMIHRPELSVYVVETTDWEKEIEEVQKAAVVVVNYDKAVSLLEALKGVAFEFIAVDEGLIKDPKTERTGALTELRKGIPYRSVMSGTLVNNSPLDIFSPIRFTEPSLVGESFSRFRDTYAVVKKLKDSEGRVVVGFRNKPEVKEILGSCGIIMTKAEWLKHLPPKQFIHKYVQMGDKQREYYHKLASNYILQIPEVNAEIEVDNPLTVLCKLNQISNGFIYYKEDIEETLNDLYGTEGRKRRKAGRQTFFFDEQPKGDALVKLIGSDEFNCDVDDTPVSRGRDLHNGSAVLGENGAHGPGCSSSEGSILEPEASDRGVRDRDQGHGTIEQSEDGSSSEGNGSPAARGDQLPSPHGSESSEPGLRKDRRAIIWFNLEAELRIIEDRLGKAGVSFLTIAGGTKNIGDIVRRFNRDPSVRFLVCQAKTINYGVTIMGTKDDDLEDGIVPQFDPRVSDEIFYSLNFSLEVFLQQQDRIHRIGQTRKCRYWLLLTNSKIERTIAERLEEKLICNREILVDIASTLDKDFAQD